MSSPRLAAARDDMYRQVITEAAEAVFAEHGYEQAKVSDLADAAGVSLATLYKVFAGKAEIHEAIHARRGEEIYQTAASSMTTFRGPFDMMLQGVEAYVRYQVEHPHYLRMVLREGYTWSEPRGMPHAHQQQVWHRGFELAAQVLGEGVAAGELREGPPERHARLMIAIIQVLLADWVERGMTEPGPALAREVCDTLVRALATPSTRARWGTTEQTP